MFIALACVLQLLESFIPYPLPGLRFGLANSITLIALEVLGFRHALLVAIARTILSSLLAGTFLSPTFILSFSGALVSACLMGVLFGLAGVFRGFRLSFLGISIAGALAHNITQLYLAYFLLIHHKGIFLMVPWLCLGSLITGWVTSMIAGGVCVRIKAMKRENITHPAFGESGLLLPLHQFYLAGTSWFYCLSAERKLIGMVMVAFSLFIFQEPPFYLGIMLLLAAVSYLSSISLAAFWNYLRRYSLLILVVFLLPLTHDFGAAGISCFRVLILIWSGFLLVATTSPEDLMRVLAKLAFPLQVFGFSEKNLAFIFASSWALVPVVWGRAQQHFSYAQLKSLRSPRRLSFHMSDFIARLYCEAEHKASCKENNRQDA